MKVKRAQLRKTVGTQEEAPWLTSCTYEGFAQMLSGLSKSNTSYAFLTLPPHASSNCSVRLPVQVPFNIVNTFQENQPAQSSLPHTGKSARRPRSHREDPTALGSARCSEPAHGEVDPGERAWQRDREPTVTSPRRAVLPSERSSRHRELLDPPSQRLTVRAPPLSRGPPSPGFKESWAGLGASRLPAPMPTLSPGANKREVTLQEVSLLGRLVVTRRWLAGSVPSGSRALSGADPLAPPPPPAPAHRPWPPGAKLPQRARKRIREPRARCVPDLVRLPRHPSSTAMAVVNRSSPPFRLEDSQRLSLP